MLNEPRQQSWSCWSHQQCDQGSCPPGPLWKSHDQELDQEPIMIFSDSSTHSGSGSRLRIGFVTIIFNIRIRILNRIRNMIKNKHFAQYHYQDQDTNLLLWKTWHIKSAVASSPFGPEQVCVIYVFFEKKEVLNNISNCIH